MDDLNIRCTEMPSPSLTAISSLLVDKPTTSNASFNPTCARLSQRIDAEIKGLFKCEYCSKSFTMRGGYKYGFLFLSEPSFRLTTSFSAAILKLIPDHTVAIPAAKGLD
jgi:hypothetical protein